MPASCSEPVQPVIGPVFDPPVEPLGLVRCALLFLSCLGRAPRVAPVSSPPGTSRTQVVSPPAQSATAMHISTRLLF
jgi:hypothetical protein